MDAECIQTVTRFVTELLCHSGDNDSFYEIILHLKRLYKRNVPACAAFLKEFVANPQILIDLLLVVRDHSIRKGISELIVQALTSVYEFEAAKLSEEKTVEVSSAVLQSGRKS